MQYEDNFHKMALMPFSTVEKLYAEIEELKGRITTLESSQIKKGIQLFGTKETAKMLGIAPNTVRDLRRIGKLESVKVNKKDFKFTEKAIQEYIAKRIA